MPGPRTSPPSGVIIYGTDAQNTLNGSPDDDIIFGGAGNDGLYGFAGWDWLDGGTGNDTTYGGVGDDVHIVDAAGDVVVEMPGEGFDVVYAINNYVLPAGAAVELLSYYDLLSPNVINLVGNEVANTIYGSAGANGLNGRDGDDDLFGRGGDDTLEGEAGNDYLDGGDGRDLLSGGTGDDVYIVGAHDVISERQGEGYDRVFTFTDYSLPSTTFENPVYVELLSAADHLTTNSMNLTGNGSDNAILGNAGANVIDGQRGHDYLVGFGGADTFVFAAGLGDVDEVADFEPGTDKILLSSYVYGDVRTDTLAAVFEVSATGATRPETRIVYDPTHGSLYTDFDGNGRGNPQNLALLRPGLALTAGDFAATASAGPAANTDRFVLQSGATAFTGFGPSFYLGNDINTQGSAPLQLVGFGGSKIALLPTGLSSGSVDTIYGTLTFSRGGSTTYGVNTNDPDYLALAPGATATDVFYYEVTNGTATSVGRVEVEFTKPAGAAVAEFATLTEAAFHGPAAEIMDASQHWEQAFASAPIDFDLQSAFHLIA
jgi:VCBS repeat-containing protein